jgi:hypothetical protein
MHETRRKEQFSLAFVIAVATIAGFAVEAVRIDDDSVDFWLVSRRKHYLIQSPRIEVQVKCTAAHAVANGELHFPLPLKNYNELRAVDTHLPRLLFVVTVPKDLNDYIAVLPDGLFLRAKCYWVSLRGMTETSNSETVTVSIPAAQCVTPESLQILMDLVGQKELA